MKRTTIAIVGFVIVLSVIAASLSVHAQASRPYRNGSIWEMSLIRVKPRMEANEQKADALAPKVVGDDQKQMQGYKERAEVREVLGTVSRAFLHGWPTGVTAGRAATTAAALRRECRKPESARAREPYTAAAPAPR
jgi:hypothetical protein